MIKRHYFALIIIFFLFYSAVTIYKSSFVVNGTRHFTLSDDLMIGMRYAYNLAHGNGLVWNAGVRVEGITNPGWVLFMALFHLLPIPLSKMSVTIQVSGAIFMAASLYFVKKIAELVSDKSFFVVLISIMFSAFYYPLINWSIVFGTEVSVLTLIITWSIYLTLKSLGNREFSAFLFILLGIGTIIRMDFVISAIVITAYLLIFDPKHRKYYFLIGIPIIALFLTIQTLFRLWYYHDILPNTYYHKMTGYPILRRIIRGIYVSIKAFLPTILSTNLFLIISPFLYAYITKNKKMFILLILFLTQLIYNSYIGGDVWELYGGANRFVAYSMPLFFISFACTLYALRNLITPRLVHARNRYRVLELLSIFLIFLVINRANEHVLPRLFLIEKPITNQENQPRVMLSYCLNAVTKPGAKIGVTAAGLNPYLTRRHFIDTLGKTEKVIARQNSRDKTSFSSTLDWYTSFYPGHMKWDYAYVIEEYKPDVFTDIYRYDENIVHLKNDYEQITIPDVYGCNKLYVLKDSPYVIHTNAKPI